MQRLLRAGAEAMGAIPIYGNDIIHTFDAVRRAGFSLPVDATEPRHLPHPSHEQEAAANAMAARLSHVPARIAYGIGRENFRLPRS
jgi:hypothetical protein